MNNKLRYTVMHYGLCAFIFFLLYILQSTPGVLNFWGYKPLLLAPCVISVAMLEQEYPGALFGALIITMRYLLSGKLRTALDLEMPYGIPVLTELKTAEGYSRYA